MNRSEDDFRSSVKEIVSNPEVENKMYGIVEEAAKEILRGIPTESITEGYGEDNKIASDANEDEYQDTMDRIEGISTDGDFASEEAFRSLVKRALSSFATKDATKRMRSDRQYREGFLAGFAQACVDCLISSADQPNPDDSE